MGSGVIYLPGLGSNYVNIMISQIIQFLLGVNLRDELSALAEYYYSFVCWVSCYSHGDLQTIINIFSSSSK